MLGSLWSSFKGILFHGDGATAAPAVGESSIVNGMGDGDGDGDGDELMTSANAGDAAAAPSHMEDDSPGGRKRKASSVASSSAFSSSSSSSRGGDHSHDNDDDEAVVPATPPKRRRMGAGVGAGGLAATTGEGRRRQQRRRRVQFSGLAETYQFDLRSPPCSRQSVALRPREEMDDEEVKKHMVHFMATRFDNLRLELERRGARIFSVAELDRVVFGEEMGLRTFVDGTAASPSSSSLPVPSTSPSSSAAAAASSSSSSSSSSPSSSSSTPSFPKLPRAELLKHLSNYYTDDSLDMFDDKGLQELFRDTVKRDINLAKKVRLDSIRRELMCRNLSVKGKMHVLVERLRKRLVEEARMFEEEDARMHSEIESMLNGPGEAARVELEKAHTDLLRDQLRNTGMDFDLEGSHAELAFRWQLWEELEHKAHARFAGMQPEKMEVDALRKELYMRRAALPEEFEQTHSAAEVRQEMITRLRRCLIEDMTKMPYKYEFGCMYVRESDIEALPSAQLLHILDLNNIVLEDSEDDSDDDEGGLLRFPSFVQAGRARSGSRLVGGKLARAKKAVLQMIIKGNCRNYVQTIKEELDEMRATEYDAQRGGGSAAAAAAAADDDDDDDFRKYFTLLERERLARARAEAKAEAKSNSSKKTQKKKKQALSAGSSSNSSIASSSTGAGPRTRGMHTRANSRHQKS